MNSLIAAAVSGEQRTRVLHNAGGEVLGCGDEFDRQCAVALPADTTEAMEAITFTGRVQVIRSDAQQAQQSKALEERFEKAQASLLALTPEPGRGRRPHLTEEGLLEALNQTLAAQRVEGLLRAEHQIEEKRVWSGVVAKAPTARRGKSSRPAIGLLNELCSRCIPIEFN